MVQRTALRWLPAQPLSTNQKPGGNSLRLKRTVTKCKPKPTTAVYRSSQKHFKVLQQLQQLVAARTQGSSRQAPHALPEAPARLPKLCSRCGQACERPKLSSGCGVARYCSGSFQKADWRAHKARCREWAAGRTKPS
ncbi:hypothetical protein WJX72_011394 [[Myrmecia] bisecta]|uniref:MYND-type domain-containing protein n=1 Tax=[Myrmecia] bisecta TaxID=41462 RepID=A0AAW1PKT4_9CHLO